MSTNDKTIKEDLYTPAFIGDDYEVEAALGTWTSLVSMVTSISKMNNQNKLGILNALTSVLSTKVNELSNPAQASMAAMTAQVNVPPVADAPVNPVEVPVSMEPVVPTAAEDEHEEQPVNANPSTEVDAPEVVALGDAEEKDNEEADEDKKAVVDLTMEGKSNERLKVALNGLEADIRKLLEGGELTDKLYDRAFGYYCASGEMDYGTAKARSGDPWNWVTNHLRSDLGKIKESIEEPNSSIIKAKVLTTQRMRELAGLATKI